MNPTKKTVMAADVMTMDVATCRPHESLERCAQVMWDLACGCLPVVDNDQRVISMITDRDICMAAFLQGKPLREIYVDSMMSKRLFTAHPETSLWSCESTMRRHAIRRLPIVNRHDVVVGILSFSDIVLRGNVGPLLTPDSLSPEAIAETASALVHASSASASESGRRSSSSSSKTKATR